MNVALIELDEDDLLGGLSDEELQYIVRSFDEQWTLYNPEVEDKFFEFGEVKLPNKSI